jgi:hypothetical protein
MPVNPAMPRRAFMFGAPLALAACGSQSIYAPDESIARAFYEEPGQKYLELFTMRNVGSGNGAHTSMIVSASQRVIWDPAGTFAVSTVPERNDVLFGVTPTIEQYYISFHSRITFYTVAQRVNVSPDVAEMALRAFMANGAVAKANCSRATSAVLQTLPGFGSIRTTYFPNNLMDQFASIPGVITNEYRENDSDDKSIAAAQIDAAIRAGQ